MLFGVRNKVAGAVALCAGVAALSATIKSVQAYDAGASIVVQMELTSK